MKKRKLQLLFLAVLTTASMLGGCLENKKTPAGQTTAGETSTVSVLTTSFPDERYQFMIAGSTRLNPADREGTSEAEELAEILSEVEELCNVKISFSPANADYAALSASVISGVKFADIVRVRQSTWIPLAVNNMLYPLETDGMKQAGLDVGDSDCFYQPYTRLTFLHQGGESHCWGVDMSGKYEQMAFGHTYAFNKDILAAVGYSPESMFSLVYNYNWTYDKMIEIATEATQDTNNDGVTDIWGIALDCDGNEIWSNDTGPIIYDSDVKKWKANCNDQKIITALTYMAALNANGKLSPPLTGEATLGRVARRALFYSGKAAFAGLYGPNYGYDGVDAGTAIMDDEVGLLPIPRGPDTQHYTMNFVDVDVYCMPKSVKRWDTAARTLNELGRRVHDDEEYAKYLQETLNCVDSYQVLTKYLLPYGMLNIAKCSDEMYEITRRNFYKSVYEGSMSPAQAAETFAPLIQAELDRVFKQY